MVLLNKFNNEKGTADPDYFISLMERYSSICIRKSKNITVVEATGTNREDFGNYFQLLKTLINENLLNKPAAIYNIDETGLNN